MKIAHGAHRPLLARTIPEGHRGRLRAPKAGMLDRLSRRSTTHGRRQEQVAMMVSTRKQ